VKEESANESPDRPALQNEKRNEDESSNERWGPVKGATRRKTACAIEEQEKSMEALMFRARGKNATAEVARADVGWRTLGAYGSRAPF
jgi:hypothetical protein